MLKRSHRWARFDHRIVNRFPEGRRSTVQILAVVQPSEAVAIHSSNPRHQMISFVQGCGHVPDSQKKKKKQIPSHVTQYKSADVSLRVSIRSFSSHGMQRERSEVSLLGGLVNFCLVPVILLEDCLCDPGENWSGNQPSHLVSTALRS